MLNIEKVTKGFYNLYRKLHCEVSLQVYGLNTTDANWYASILLNRLMFAYFLQKNSFLNGDCFYLKNHYERITTIPHQSYYKDFLLTFFHRGLSIAKNERKEITISLLGDIPYINGDLFSPHLLEVNYPDIQLDNNVFAEIFTAFERYNWDLKTHSFKDATITPEIVGNLFEKYINQKQMGAYYTKEDVRDYITKNTIIPFILNKIKQKHPVELNKLLQDFAPNMTEKQAVTDLITNNVDVEKLLQTIIRNCDHPAVILELYHILAGEKDNRPPLSVLDPNCGSGAFLFSALKILEPIYETCLEKMAELAYTAVLEKDTFLKVSNEVAMYNNPKVFVCKTIIEKNLYGVDIMSEATEIAKLDLLLMLLSETEDIDSLSNIRFNILTGNTLVGFVHSDKSLTRKELNRLLSQDYNVDEKETASWVQNILPFQWGIEFQEIMQNGGFDCVIGNPPYVEYSKVRKMYEVKGFDSLSCNNLYAFVLERSYSLLQPAGYLGMIVPISLVSTPRMAPIREIIINQSETACFANFGDRPGTLFNGVHQKLTILLGKKKADNSIHPAKTFTTNYYHWYSSPSNNERNTLFKNLYYTENDVDVDGNKCILKVGCEIDKSIWNKMQQKRKSICDFFFHSTGHPIHLNMRMTFWGKCFLSPKASKEFKTLQFPNAEDAKIAMCMFNSSLFFYFWEIVSDCWHITQKELNLFKVDMDKLSDSQRQSLCSLAVLLEDDLEKNKGYIGTIQTDYEYYHKKSKHIIDQIDKVLAAHYGFTQDELDYIINYNLKYRMSNEFPKINLQEV